MESQSDISDITDECQVIDNVEFKSENILWPNIRMFFEQRNNYTTDTDTDTDKKGNISFRCILCKPKVKFISTSSTSNSNLRTHIKVIFCLIISYFTKFL